MTEESWYATVSAIHFQTTTAARELDRIIFPLCLGPRKEDPKNVSCKGPPPKWLEPAMLDVWSRGKMGAGTYEHFFMNRICGWNEQRARGTNATSSRQTQECGGKGPPNYQDIIVQHTKAPRRENRATPENHLSHPHNEESHNFRAGCWQQSSLRV